MAKHVATVPRPFDEVWPVLDGIAIAQGWLVHLNSTKHDRVYSKDAGLNSWGVTLRVRLEDSGGTTTVTCETKNWAIPDRVRARKGFEALIGSLGGRVDK